MIDLSNPTARISVQTAAELQIAENGNNHSYQFPLLDYSPPERLDFTHTMGKYSLMAGRLPIPVSKIYSGDRHRKTYVDWQFRFNAAGAPPPAFRKYQPRIPAVNLSPMEVIASHDKKIIDLHWCYTNRERLESMGVHSGIEPELEVYLRGAEEPLEVFNDLEFDFHAAALLVQFGWTSAHIAEELLELSAFTQCCLSSLKCQQVRQLTTKAERARKRARKILGEQANNSRSRMNSTSVANLSEAACFLTFAGGHPHYAAILQQLVQGTRTDHAALKKRARWYSDAKAKLARFQLVI